MRTVEIVASFSGTVNIGDYNNESPFFSIKECFEAADGEWSDELISDRHMQLQLMCYEKFEAMKEEALRPMMVAETEVDPVSSVPQMEEIRQKAIELIKEQGKWFKENKFAVQFKALYKDIFKKDYDNNLQKLTFSGARHLNRKLGALKQELEMFADVEKS